MTQLNNRKKATRGNRSRSSSSFDLFEVQKYQNRIRYWERGHAIYRAIQNCAPFFDPTPEQVAVINAVMICLRKNGIEYGWQGVSISVQGLWSFITPYNSSKFDKRKKEHTFYMGSVTQNSIDVLASLGILYVKNHSQGRTREFGLSPEFSKSYRAALKEVEIEVKDLTNMTPEDLLDLELNLKPNALGSGFERLNRINDVTVKTVKKLQQCQFVFDSAFYNSPEGKAWINEQLSNHSSGREDAVRESIHYTLEGFTNTHTNEPQYFGSWHLQNTGRMHTVGGPIGLPKWFRKRFILPVDRSNIRVEADLKCAQLLILADLLKLDDWRDNLIQIIEEQGSVWPRIGPTDMDKRVKKVIVYAFCYGGQISNLPYLATKEASSRGLDVTVTKEDVSKVLDCELMAPLVEAREKALEPFTIERIRALRTDTVKVNDLGLKFHLKKEAEEYIGSDRPTKAKMQSTKIGSMLFAHLAQGREQNIVQNLIANHTPYNIVTFQYDGWTVELPPEELDEYKEAITTAAGVPVEFEIFDNQSDSNPSGTEGTKKAASLFKAAPQSNQVKPHLTCLDGGKAKQDGAERSADSTDGRALDLQKSVGRLQNNLKILLENRIL